MKNIFFVAGEVGEKILQWLLEFHSDDIGMIVHTGDDQRILDICHKHKLNSCSVANIDILENKVFDLGFTVWWPTILTANVLKIATRGFVNTHPSLLPAQRGKGTSFWNIIEGTDFGVTIHRLTEKIDKGEILAQRQIEVTWEDTGGSLATKAQNSMYELFVSEYPFSNEFNGFDENRLQVSESFHNLSEMFDKSQLDLDERLSIRDTLNLLRAKTHHEYPGCTFVEDDVTYYVQIMIRKAKSD